MTQKADSLHIHSQPAEISTLINPKFYGNWELQKTYLKFESEEENQAFFQSESKFMILEKKDFETKIFPKKYFNYKMGSKLESFKVHREIFSTNGLIGNKVVFVVTYFQKGKSSRKDSLFYQKYPESLAMISASIRDFELVNESSLVEVRRGYTYNLSQTDKSGSVLEEGPYEAVLYYKLQ